MPFYHKICARRIFWRSISSIIRHVKAKNVVGAKVRQARKSAKPPITQLELVARLQTLGIQIDQSGLSKVENGQRPVFDAEVVAFAKALGVTSSWLLQDSEADGKARGAKP